MSLLDLLSPLLRQNYRFWIIVFLVMGSVFGFTYSQISGLQKTTIFFTVKPIFSEKSQGDIVLDVAESTMKSAETIAGWAKNPAFREAVQARAGIQIKSFKNKISAGKQNRMNVFWTVTLNREEAEKTNAVVESLIKEIHETITQTNQKNPFPFDITPPRFSTESTVVPTLWIFIFSICCGLFFAVLWAYLVEVLTDRVSFFSTVRDYFDSSVPVLKIGHAKNAHQEVVVKKFLDTYENPRIITTFPIKNAFWDVMIREDVEENFSNILLVQLGKSRMTEMENQAAIHEVDGVIVFSK